MMTAMIDSRYLCDTYARYIHTYSIPDWLLAHRYNGDSVRYSPDTVMIPFNRTHHQGLAYQGGVHTRGSVAAYSIACLHHARSLHPNALIPFALAK